MTNKETTKERKILGKTHLHITKHYAPYQKDKGGMVDSRLKDFINHVYEPGGPPWHNILFALRDSGVEYIPCEDYHLNEEFYNCVDFFGLKHAIHYLAPVFDRVINVRGTIPREHSNKGLENLEKILKRAKWVLQRDSRKYLLNNHQYFASIYGGKLSNDFEDFTGFYNLAEMKFLVDWLRSDLGVEGEIPFQYCKCADEEEASALGLELDLKPELVQCGFDEGFYDALRLEFERRKK